MDTITFRCGSCNQQYTVGADKAGKKTRCAKCETFLTVPAAPAKKHPVKTEKVLEEETLTKNSEADVIEAGIEIVEQAPEPAKAVTKSKRLRQAQNAEDAEAETRTYFPRSVDREGHGSTEEAGAALPRKGRSKRRRGQEDDDTAVAEIDDEPIRRKKPRSRAANWQKVRLGLLLHLIILVVTVGTVILSFAAVPFILPKLFSSNGFDSITTFLRVVQVGYFGLTLLWIAGCVLYLFSPWEHNSKKFAIALLVVGSTSLLFTTLLNPLGLSGTAYDSDNFKDSMKGGKLEKLEDLKKDMNKEILKGQILGIFTFLLGAVKDLLVPIFLWSLAQCLKARGLDDNCLTLSKYTIGSVLIGFIFMGMSLFPVLVFVGCIMIPLGILAFICAIGQIIWTFLILINTRRVIEEKYC